MREEDVHGSASTVDASVAQHRASESFVVHRNPAFEQQEGFATPNPLQSGRRGEGTSRQPHVHPPKHQQE
jgi:hypothetical protein